MTNYLSLQLRQRPVCLVISTSTYRKESDKMFLLSFSSPRGISEWDGGVEEWVLGVGWGKRDMEVQV